MKTLTVSKARESFSDLVRRVIEYGESVLITRRGKPVVKLVPARQPHAAHLGDVVGWLADDDPFFDSIEEVIRQRSEHTPRAFQSDPMKNRDFTR